MAKSAADLEVTIRRGGVKMKELERNEDSVRCGEWEEN